MPLAERSVTDLNRIKSAIALHLDVADTSPVLDEAHLYLFATGTCRPADTEQVKKPLNVCLNPTLFHPDNQPIHHSALPFNSYLPLPPTVQSATEYCLSSLTDLVKQFRVQADGAKFTFHSADPNHFFLGATKFDLIDASDLCDRVGLVNLLISAGRILGDRPESVLVLETDESILPHDLEDRLCAPLSMLPSLYGLRLAHPDVHLGQSTPSFIRRPISMIWHRTPTFGIIRPTFSEALKNCLERLKDKCYPPETTTVLALLHSERNRTTVEAFSPLTYNRAIGALTSRCRKSDDDVWLQCLRANVPLELKLMRWTLDAWLTGHPLVRLTADDAHFDPKVLEISKLHPSVPVLRLLILPTAQYCEKRKKKPYSSLESFHWIDNFFMDAASGRVAFLLPENHCLEGTHSAVVVHWQTGAFLVHVGPLILLRSEPFTLVHPFALNPSGSKVKSVAECTESFDGYSVVLKTTPSKRSLSKGRQIG